MTLEEVKAYLRVDSEEDDGTIRQMMDAAESYIVDAAGRFDGGNSKARMLYRDISLSLARLLRIDLRIVSFLLPPTQDFLQPRTCPCPFASIWRISAALASAKPQFNTSDDV